MIWANIRPTPARRPNPTPVKQTHIIFIYNNKLKLFSPAPSTSVVSGHQLFPVKIQKSIEVNKMFQL